MWKAISFVVALSAVFIVIQAQDICLQCTSNALHPECITLSSDFSGTCSGPSANRTCYSRIDQSGNVIRGCFNQLDNSTASDCDSETCQTCVGNNCNEGIFPERRLFCHRCAGGVNSTCAGIINATMTVCPIYQRDDQCYVARPHGNYERGCISSSTEQRCAIDEKCLICSGDGCNYVDYSSATNINSIAKVVPFIALSVALTVFNKLL